MRSINKVILIGNLTRDPELRQTPNGQNVSTFGIATNRVWETSSGIKQTSVEFHELVAWAKLAENCHKNLKKGKLIYIEGYLKTRSWDTPEGVRKFKTEIIVQDMIMLEKRPREDHEEIHTPDKIEQHTPEIHEMPEPIHAASSKNEVKHTPTPTEIDKKDSEEKPETEENPPKHKLSEKKPKKEGPVEIDTDLGL